MDRSSGEQFVRQAFSAMEAHAVTFTFEEQAWTASLAELGMRIDYAAMLDEAMTQGRDGTLLDRYQSLVGRGEELQVALSVSQDRPVLDSYLDGIAAKIATEPRDARLVRQGDQISIRDHAYGRRLNIDRARADAVAAVSSGRTTTVALSTIAVEPEITTTALRGAQEQASRLIGEPVVFTHEGDSYPIDVEALTSALVIDRDGTATLRADRIAERIDAIERAVYVPARNVMLGWDSGLYVVEDDVEGVELDREMLAQVLTSTALSATRVASLPIVPVRAGARTDNVDELGIEQHLAYGSSVFAGSSETRATNVVVSSNNISYKLVGPGESFSFNELMGPITLDNGFVEGSIIQGDWTASDLGGGVCQVSTTVFRAALYAGFRFSEWHPHSWRLAFYEADGSAPGLDAAIYQPNHDGEWEKDLIFENPLDSWLLLMMVVDGGTVSAHFYGRDNGWTVEVFESRVSEPKPVGDAVVRENAALAPGDRRMVQQARPGYEVRVRRKVTGAGGEVISDGDFVSDYRSQPEALEVGPAT